MPWTIQCCIAQVVVRITSPHLQFKADIQHLTQLYPSNHATHAHIHFTIAQQQDNYVLALGSHTVWQSQDSRDMAPSFELSLYQEVLKELSPQGISLHASSVAYASKVYVFAGVSGAGKSSLCTAALLDGAAYLTDEFSLLGKDKQLHPFPRPLQWDSIDHPAFSVQQLLQSGLFKKEQFAFPTPEGDLLTSHLWLPKNVQATPLPISSLILPQYSEHAPAATLTPIRRGEALMHLPEHLHTRQSHPEMLKLLNQRLPQETSFFRLAFSDVFAAWEAVKNISTSATSTSDVKSLSPPKHRPH